MRIGPGARLTAMATLGALAGAACTNTPNGAPPRPEAGADAPTDGATAGDGGDAGDAPPGVADVDAFIARLAGAMCNWQFRCCSLAEIDATSGSSYLTEADCRGAITLGLVTFFGDVRSSVAEDRLALDPDLADACVKRFDPGGCSSPSLPGQDPFGLFQLCADPFVGRVPEGSPCRTADECVPGARCVTGGQFFNSTPGMTVEGLSPIPNISYVIPLAGTCQAYASEGDRCRVAVDCAPGLYCRGTDFVCAKPAGDGQTCHPLNDPNGLPSVGPPCDDANQNLACVHDVCGRLPRAGEPCLPDTSQRPACDPDPALALACVGAGFNGAGICTPLGKVGDACGSDGLAPCAINLDCIFDEATPGLGTCQRLPSRGEPCRVDQPCAQPYVCDGDSSTCAMGGTHHDGEPCTTDLACASSNCFVAADGGTCGPSSGITVTCTGRGAPGAM